MNKLVFISGSPEIQGLAKDLLSSHEALLVSPGLIPDYLGDSEASEQILLVDEDLLKDETLSLIQASVKERRALAFIALIKDKSIDSAMKAMRAGAWDFFPVNNSVEELLDLVERVRCRANH
ncbi:MAG: hypothetical protein OEZ36_04010 [Spirochaetota bacterium]|nr:hypothetical protein [Spirochaetota bacterium]